MKTNKQTIRSLSYLLFVVMWSFSACHKEDDDINVSPDQIGGTFSAFEAFINGELVSLPTADERIEVKIESTNAEKATVVVTYYAHDKPQTSEPIACTVGKDTDGFTYLNIAETSETIVYYYDKNTIDLTVPNSGSTVSASRDGKKPKWWDD